MSTSTLTIGTAADTSSPRSNNATSTGLVTSCNGVDMPSENRYHCRFPGCAHATFTASSSRCRHEREVHRPATPPPPVVVTEPCLLCLSAFPIAELRAHILSCVADGIVIKADAATTPAVSLPRPLLDDSPFDAFVIWMQQPAATMWSQTLKKKLPSPAATQRHRETLRRLVTICMEICPTLFLNGASFHLGMLLKHEFITALQQYHQTVRARAARDGDDDVVGVGPDVVNKRMLVLRKLVVYFAETLNVTPSSFSVWIPVQESGRHSSLARHRRVKRKVCVDELLNADDLTTIVRCAQQQMDKLRQANYSKALSIKERQLYSKCLYVLLTCVLQGPRPQVLAQMSTTTLHPPLSTYNDSDNWRVLLSGDRLKNGQDWDYTIHSDLSIYLRFHIARILPQSHVGSIWIDERGNSRKEFGDFCSSVVFTFTHKHATPQVLRTAKATANVSRAQSFAEQQTVARVQDHSVATQERYYVLQDLRASQLSMAEDDLRQAKKQRAELLER